MRIMKQEDSRWSSGSSIKSTYITKRRKGGRELRTCWSGDRSNEKPKLGARRWPCRLGRPCCDKAGWPIQRRRAWWGNMWQCVRHSISITFVTVISSRSLWLPTWRHDNQSYIQVGRAVALVAPSIYCLFPGVAFFCRVVRSSLGTLVTGTSPTYFLFFY
jgi:hypothetical protein